MAALTRRTWANIRDEVIKRCGNITATGFSSRVEYCCWAAHDYLCSTYHHFELDVVDTSITLSTSVNTITLPARCNIVIGLKLLNAAGSTVVGEVTCEDARPTVAKYIATSGTPKRYGRFGGKLYLDAKPDVAYRSELYYYAFSAAPDFASTSPETASDVDEHIIEMACHMVSGATGDGAFAGVNRELLSEWLAAQVRNPIGIPLPDVRERFATQTTLGGAQG